jgi:hypothetical protein
MTEATVLRTKPLSYAIVYGLASGKLQSKALEAALQSQGLVPSSDASGADILIAHSGGCWLLPPEAQAQVVLMTGAPLRHRHTFGTYLMTNMQLWLTAVHDHYLRQRLVWSLYGAFYLLREPWRNGRVIRACFKAGELQAYPSAQTFFIANQHDPWPKGDNLEQLLKAESWTFISLQGSHEAIYETPEAYTSILKRSSIL